MFDALDARDARVTAMRPWISALSSSICATACRPSRIKAAAMRSCSSSEERTVAEDNADDTSIARALDAVTSVSWAGAMAGAATTDRTRTVVCSSLSRGPLTGGSGGLYEPLDIVCPNVSAEHGGEKPVVSMADDLPTRIAGMQIRLITCRLVIWVNLTPFS